MATQSKNLQKDKNELLEFVKNCDLNEQEKEQINKDLLEIFEFEEELDEILSRLKDNIYDLKIFQAQVEVELINIRYQKEIRAIQSRIKRILNPSKEEKVQCKVGIHAGEYQQKEGMPKCYWWKICPDCNELFEKYEHQYGYWERKDSHNPCRVSRECEYCEHREYRIEHTYDLPLIKEGCQVFEVCSYCGYKQIKGTSHDWRFMDGGKKYCARCGTQKYIS